MAEIKSMLDGVIEREINELSSLDSREEKSSAIKDLVQLHKLRIEEIKTEAEVEDKRERRAMDSKKNEADLTFKEKQFTSQTEQNAQELVLKEREIEGKDADRAHEDAIAQQSAKDNKVDRYVRTGVAVAELVVPLVFYGIWMGQGFRFEESGSFTSTTFKNLLSRFRPTK